MSTSRQRGVTNRLALLLAVVTSLTTVAISQAPVRAEDPPRSLVFGAYAHPRPGQSSQAAVLELESQLGRKLEVVRDFHLWEDPFPDAFDQFLEDGGRTPMISVRPRRANGTIITWLEIANAAPDSKVDLEIRSWARRVREFGSPIYVTFHHEPETAINTAYGTPADYIAAWRRWVDVFREEGVDNARFMWIMTDYSMAVTATARNYAPKWYPGDDWVDSMGTDAYNWHKCRPTAQIPWQSLETIADYFRRFGALHPTKPLWLTEWASVDDPAVTDRRVTWFNDARALFSRPAYGQFAGVSYFNYSAAGDPCAWRVDATASILASFAAMGTDPLYSGDGDFPMGPPPPPPPPPPNQDPIAGFTSTSDGLTASFASTSQDNDGTITGSSWDFGDGSTPSSTGSQVSHSYAGPGTYQVALTVTDDEGATNTVTKSVTVVEAVAALITHVGTATANVNATSHRVVVPAEVQTGDALVLAFTSNTTATVGTPTGLSGWRLLGTRANSQLSSRMWTLAAPAGSAGKTLTVPVSAISKGNMVLSAYRGTSKVDPVASASSALETVSRAGHTAPAVNVGSDRSWVVWYWVHKDSTTSTLTPPSGATARANGGQSGSGRVTGLFADSGGPVGPGEVSGKVATASAASVNAAMWSIVLAPE
jgi:PKD repeat protein